MSCENPTNDADALMPRRRKYDRSKTCVKCKERQGNIVIRHVVYCKDCQVPLMTFKFRRALEPFVNAKPDGPRRTALKPTGNLLVGFSGGLGSTVLLDLVNRCYVNPDPELVTSEGGKDHPRNERVWKQVTVCYIEVSDAVPGTTDRTEEIRTIVMQCPGVTFLPLRIQDAFDPTWWTKVGLNNVNAALCADLADEMLPLKMAESHESPLTAMRSYLASLPTPTALPATLRSIIRVLLQHTALQTGSSHLLLGTSLTSLAMSLISGIAQGGGFHVKEEAQEEWIPPHGKPRSIRILRPLKDIGLKECGIWAWWMQLPIVGRESWQWPGTKPGLSNLTKDFIVRLEKDYPSTVSTIVRTCGKLAPKGETVGACIVCQRPIQAGVQDWKARISIRTHSEDHEDLPDSTDKIVSLVPYLCYVCHTTLTSRGTRTAPPLYPNDPSPSPMAAPLPIWTRNANVLYSQFAPTPQEDDSDVEQFRTRLLNQTEMRETVQDFLLDD